VSILDQERPPKQKKQRPPKPTSASVPASAALASPSAAQAAVSPKRSSVIKANGSTPERDKGRPRKVVTFGEQPEVKVIDPSAGVEAPAPPSQVGDDHVAEGASAQTRKRFGWRTNAPAESIFDIEGLDEAHPSLPSAPQRTRDSMQQPRLNNGRAARTSSLLASMSYRPPSAIPQKPNTAPRTPISASAPTPSALDVFKPHEQQLRQLVGADLPSHRNGWKKNGRAWAMFARGRRADSSALMLDDEDDEDVAGQGDYSDSEDSDDQEAQRERAMKFGAGSLPIAIAPIHSLGRPRPAASVATKLPTVADAEEGAEPATARERARSILENRLSPASDDPQVWRSVV
jgi:hypothetical protein